MLRLFPLASACAKIQNRKAICVLSTLLMLGLGVSAAHAATPFDPTSPTNAGINQYGYRVVTNYSLSGNIIVTASYTEETTDDDTPSTVTQNDYQITLEGILNGSKTVFDQTFAVPFSDPSVQSAVTQADADLMSAGATLLDMPTLTVNTTALTDSKLVYTQTGSSSSSSTTDATIFGPATLYNVNSGPVTSSLALYFDPVFTVIAGQEDENINTDTQLTIDRNAVTTDTDLTSQTYIIDGTSSAVGQTVPLPPAAWQALTVFSMFGLVGLKRKCFPAPAFSPKSRRRL